MVDSGRWLEGKGQGQVSALADSRQSLMVGARVLASQSTGFDEGGSSDNEPQKAASVCISDAQGQREPLSRDAGLDGREKVGTTVCPSPRCKPQPGQGPGRQRASWQADKPCQTPIHFPDLPGSRGSGSTPAGTPPSGAHVSRSSQLPGPFPQRQWTSHRGRGMLTVGLTHGEAQD